MTKKSDEQVQAEIGALTELLPQLPQRARHAVDAALEVLRDDLSDDAVYEKFEEGTEEFEDALTACMWRDGVSGSEALSAQYRQLI
ncbi:hypothetical protein PAN31117_01758 [Pandoraea anapnoica]|uniref:Uncharacterized protein n=1 Tax=Pandoraea anapnoica TaxID=2508301 RepID=A0A5E4ZX44_9BURK|nr:hypothetical protein [Pandoraea anapnoica]VVE65102.1 hypothetical protein PAN31117_01758 [Pandoraea anapnoica]